MLGVSNYAPDDVDVLVVLGVLYNVTQDLNSAIDCFRRAIEFRSEDYSLHNKLGATLANSNQSETAISSYTTGLITKSYSHLTSH